MNGCGVQQQIEQSERKQKQAGQGTDGSSARQPGAEQHKMTDDAQVLAVEPEAVSYTHLTLPTKRIV